MVREDTRRGHVRLPRLTDRLDGHRAPAVPDQLGHLVLESVGADPPGRHAGVVHRLRRRHQRHRTDGALVSLFDALL